MGLTTEEPLIFLQVLETEKTIIISVKQMDLDWLDQYFTDGQVYKKQQ